MCASMCHSMWRRDDNSQGFLPTTRCPMIELSAFAHWSHPTDPYFYFKIILF